MRLCTLSLVAAGALTLAAGTALGQDRTPVRWGVAVNLSLSHAIAPMLELDDEIQARHGLAFTTTDFNANVMGCIAALLSGDVDTCQNGITVGMNAIAEGGDFLGFMQMIGQITELTVSARAIERSGVGLDASPEARIAALRGMRIAGPGPGTNNYYLMEEILAVAGLTMADVTYQPLLDVAAMNASLINDRIDAVLAALFIGRIQTHFHAFDAVFANAQRTRRICMAFANEFQKPRADVGQIFIMHSLIFGLRDFGIINGDKGKTFGHFRDQLFELLAVTMGFFEGFTGAQRVFFGKGAFKQAGKAVNTSGNFTAGFCDNIIGGRRGRYLGSCRYKTRGRGDLCDRFGRNPFRQ